MHCQITILIEQSIQPFPALLLEYSLSNGFENVISRALSLVSSNPFPGQAT